MPTYDYRCTLCGHEFEEFQSIKADPLKQCPECEQKGLKRLIGTGAGILFKGSGFYETDYRSEGYKKAQKAESDAAKPKSESDNASKSKSDSGGSAKKDTSTTDKPAAKSE